MSSKDQLRNQRYNTIINEKSKREDKQCQNVVKAVIDALSAEFGVKIEWQKKVLLSSVVESLKQSYPDIEFAEPNKTSFMSPDGGVTYLVGKDGTRYPILIAEVKNQGTNDFREQEGLKKQAQGNAVERLGKNVIGFRAYMMNESIFPFVCFGDGCDFLPGSSILDRIITIAMFGELNKDHTANEGANGAFNRGSYYFRGPYWTAQEMYNILYDVAKRSVYYYFAKYGEKKFK